MINIIVQAFFYILGIIIAIAALGLYAGIISVVIRTMMDVEDYPKDSLMKNKKLRITVGTIIIVFMVLSLILAVVKIFI